MTLDNWYKYAKIKGDLEVTSWYNKLNVPHTPKKLPYKIMKVKNDTYEPISGISEVIYSTTAYGALIKFLKKYQFLNDYIEIGVIIDAVVDKDTLEKQQQEYRRKIEEEQRNKNDEAMKDTWYWKESQ